MFYIAYIFRDGKHALAEFPDCPGCQTFADSGDELAEAAREALEGWLEAHLVGGQIPPRPREHARAPAGTRMARVGVRPGLAAAIQIRWARQDADLSQKELGKLARVTQQQIAKLENPDENPTLESLEKVGKALGLDVTIGLQSPQKISVPSPSRRKSEVVLAARPTLRAHERSARHLALVAADGKPKRAKPTAPAPTKTTKP